MNWEQRLHAGGDEPVRVHLIGVAGSGMSGLASLLLGLGHRVSGSDRVSSKETERLQRAGLDFSSPHSAEAVAGTDLVVYSSAVKAGNAAYDAALAAGIPTLRRAEALAAIMAGKRGVVVAGTHGKTTTSALAAHVLRAAGLQPGHYVGAEIPVLGTNAHWSEGGDLFVAEGDESDGSLTLFKPEFAILLNVEEEHLDHYADGIEGIRRVFGEYLANTSGPAIYCADDAEAAVLCATREDAISYGWDATFDFSAAALSVRDGSTEFDVLRRGEKLGRVTLGVPGEHNVLNALAVIALADRVGADFATVAEALRSFRGARRRFDVLYRSADHAVIDDYGHHPTEIRATVETALSLNPERLVCLFQPHRYSRTKLLRDGFGGAFRGVDALFVTDIYPASEAPIPGISGETVLDAVRENGGRELFSAPDVKTAHHAVGAYLRRGDTVLTLGAGNIHEAGKALARDLELLDKLRRELDDPETVCRLYEPMRRHTTMKVGGPAQFWVEPVSTESFARALRFFRAAGLPVRVVGRGSNLLVRDGGIPGAVIRPGKGEFDEVRVSGGLITAGVGARFKKLSNVAKAHGIGGFEWMEGIPGNVGGGLRMNAGAMGAQTFDQVVSVQFLDGDGELHERPAGEFAARYRHVEDLVENYAVSAVFRGDPAADPVAIAAGIAGSMGKRKSSQPVAASAGCTFKNPEAVPAGRLIEELGLKGVAVGGASVSDVHGNFIVNAGAATAADVLTLIALIKDKARSERGIELETEVQIIGEVEATF